MKCILNRYKISVMDSTEKNLPFTYTKHIETGQQMKVMAMQ